MTTISASEAKTHFGALIDKAQKEPVTIEKQGRPVVVVLSYEEYQELNTSSPSQNEREQALDFLNSWSKRAPVKVSKKMLQNDVRAEAIWAKYTQ